MPARRRPTSRCGASWSSVPTCWSRSTRRSRWASRTGSAGRTLEEETGQTSKLGLSLFPDTTRIGPVGDRRQPHRRPALQALVPIGALPAQLGLITRRQQLQQIDEGLQPSKQPLQLNNAILAGYKAMIAAYQPHFSNALIVLTAGVDTGRGHVHGRADRPGEEAVQPQRPVQIVDQIGTAGLPRPCSTSPRRPAAPPTRSTSRPRSARSSSRVSPTACARRVAPQRPGRGRNWRVCRRAPQGPRDLRKRRAKKCLRNLAETCEPAAQPTRLVGEARRERGAGPHLSSRGNLPRSGRRAYSPPGSRRAQAARPSRTRCARSISTGTAGPPARTRRPPSGAAGTARGCPPGPRPA